MAELHDGVSLTELGVITRWSLAVRQPQAERADLIAELKADLAWLERSGRGATPARTAASTLRPSLTLSRAKEEIDEAVDDEEAESAPSPRPVAPLRRLPRDPGAQAPAPATTRSPAPARSSIPARPLADRSPAKAAPAKAAASKSTPAKAAVVKAAPAKRAAAKKTTK